MGSLAAGVMLFVLSFAVLDFVWTHVIVTDPKQIGLGDGVIVVGGGFVIGCTLGLGALVFVLYRFWPGRASR
ncbi:MAG: hypothetical protein WA261_09925 [Candidatus Sulfotelmatobacter sp.]